jgi:hypothetical protein
MSNTNPNDAAFARPLSVNGINITIPETYGLTKREYFAAKAFQALITSDNK